MADMNTVLKLGIDAVAGRVSGNFAASDMQAGFVDGIRELNAGSTKLNPRTFHRGSELFALVEELIPYITNAGLRADDYFMSLVDERNLAEGDEAEFYTDDKALFFVANIANGTQSVRRQRLNAGDSITVPTQMRAIKVYEELRRLLAGRVDFNTFINRVSESFMQQVRTDCLTALEGITTATKGLNSTYVVSGSYSTSDLLDLVAHVEADTGKVAKIFGTKAALRKVTDATLAGIDAAKEDLYNMGYFGKFYGTDMIAMKQAHKADGTTFALSDSKVYVIASDDHPIKLVNEGTGLLIEGNPVDNADLTQTYLYGQAYGVGIICNEKIGVYTITG